MLACRYVDEVIIGAPWEITKDMVCPQFYIIYLFRVIRNSNWCIGSYSILTFFSVVLFLTNFLVYSSEGFNSSMHDSCIKITYCGLGYIVEPTSYTVLKLVSIGVLIASIVS